jgi:hypothetical protein
MRNRSKLWRLWYRLRALVAIAIVAVIAGCNPAKAPVPRHVAHGVVLAVAHAVKAVDLLCAQRAQQLYDDGKQDAALTLADTCAEGYGIARKAVVAAAYAVDAWGDAEANGQALCALGSGVQSLNATVAVVTAAGVKMPREVTDALDGFEALSAVVGGACRVRP